MIEVELACAECGGVIVLLNPPLDLIEYPMCDSCRTRDDNGGGCDSVTDQTAPTTGPRRV